MELLIHKQRLTDPKLKWEVKDGLQKTEFEVPSGAIPLKIDFDVEGYPAVWYFFPTAQPVGIMPDKIQIFRALTGKLFLCGPGRYATTLRYSSTIEHFFLNCSHWDRLAAEAEEQHNTHLLHVLQAPLGIN